MNRRNFLKTVAQAAAVAAVVPKSLLDSPVTMGVDTALAADCTSVVIWRARNDLYYYVGSIMVNSPRTMFSITNIHFPDPDEEGRALA